MIGLIAFFLARSGRDFLKRKALKQKRPGPQNSGVSQGFRAPTNCCKMIIFRNEPLDFAALMGFLRYAPVEFHISVLTKSDI